MDQRQQKIFYFEITEYNNSDTHNILHSHLWMYECRCANPTLISIFETEPTNPRDWQNHHRRLTVDRNVATIESTIPLNPLIFTPKGSQTYDLPRLLFVSEKINIKAFCHGPLGRFKVVASGPWFRDSVRNYWISPNFTHSGQDRNDQQIRSK